MKTTRQPLPPDCLLGGKVHPSIAERLERVRQLPVAAVANYLGLQEEAGQFWMVWQQLDATPIAEIDWATLSHEQRSKIAAQLSQVLAAMHSHGIVHGTVNASNVLLDRTGNLHLTHISPLLYDDPAYDELSADLLMGHILPDGESDTKPATPSDRPRQTGWSILLIAGVGILMFFGLLWYSQHR